MKSILIFTFWIIIAGCIPTVIYSTTYTAKYDISLSKVERPEDATERYGEQFIDILDTENYKYFFEDNLVKVLWVVDNRNIALSLENKTKNSIRIPWDEGVFVDMEGSSHRIIHSGINYSDRNQPQAPSIIARQTTLEEIIIPIGYIEKPFFPDFDYHTKNSPGVYSTFKDFETIVDSKVGKSIQVLIPLQIEDITNDYIFTFEVISVSTSQKTEKNTYY